MAKTRRSKKADDGLPKVKRRKRVRTAVRKPACCTSLGHKEVIEAGQLIAAEGIKADACCTHFAPPVCYPYIVARPRTNRFDVNSCLKGLGAQ